MLYSIQACRAFAALFVVFFHSAGTLAKEKYFGAVADPINHIFWFGGDAGVAFFFVLSGFIIHYVHAQDFNQPNKLFTYLRKRVVRIYPTYWIIFISVFILAKSVPSLGGAMPNDITVIIKSLFLFPQDIKVVGGTGAPVIDVAWSLQYEIMFYAFFALAIISRWLFISIAVVLVLNFSIGPLFGYYSFPWSFFSSHLIFLFVMGVCASAIAKKRVLDDYVEKIVTGSVICFFTVALFATLNIDNYNKSLFDLLYGVASAVLIIGLASLPKQSKINHVSRRFSSLGDASYALYLIHFPVISVLAKISMFVLPKNINGVICAFLLLVFGSVIAGLIFNRYIERPLLQLLSGKK